MQKYKITLLLYLINEFCEQKDNILWKHLQL